MYASFIKIEEIFASSLTHEAIIDYLEIEWFEVNRTTIKRQSIGGMNFFIQRKQKKPLYNDDVLWSDGHIAVLVRIKPCDCIVLKTSDLKTVGFFCSDIGNQHLPLFLLAHDTLCVAYDGRLYQALWHQYGSLISIETCQLLPQAKLTPFYSISTNR
ncbi:urease accessory protein UreE [Olivibacter sp. SA151]|uniref:urease accessory protein UreE n=1 Tax=Olivibacter jilunii TaxID=985016 RepID=UPI003F13730F